MGIKVFVVCFLLLDATRVAENASSKLQKAVINLADIYRKNTKMLAWPLGYENFTTESVQDDDSAELHDLFKDNVKSIITIESVVFGGRALTELVGISNKVIVTENFIFLDDSHTPRVNLNNVTVIAKLVLIINALNVSGCLIISENVKIQATSLNEVTVVSKKSVLVYLQSLSKNLIISENLELDCAQEESSHGVHVQKNVFIAGILHLNNKSQHCSSLIEANLFYFNEGSLWATNCNYQNNLFVGYSLWSSYYDLTFNNNKLYLEEEQQIGETDKLLHHSNTLISLTDMTNYVDTEKLNQEISTRLTETYERKNINSGVSGDALLLKSVKTLFNSAQESNGERIQFETDSLTDSNYNSTQLVQVQWSVDDFWRGVSTLLSGVLPAMKREMAFTTNSRFPWIYADIHSSSIRFDATLSFNIQFFETVESHLEKHIVSNRTNTDCQDPGMSSLVNLKNLTHHYGPAYRAWEMLHDLKDTVHYFRELNYFSSGNFLLQEKILVGHTVNFDNGMLRKENLTFNNVTVIAVKVRFRILQSAFFARLCLIVADDVQFDLLDNSNYVELDLCTIIAKTVSLKTKYRVSPLQKPSVDISILDSKLVARKVQLTAHYVHFVRLILAANELHFNFNSWSMENSVIIAENAVLSHHGRFFKQYRNITSTKFFAKMLSARNFVADNRDNVVVADILELQCENNRKVVKHNVSERNAILHNPLCSQKCAVEHDMFLVNLTSELLQPSEVGGILLQAFESSADSIESLAFQPSIGSVNLQHHLFDLFSAVQIAAYSQMELKLCPEVRSHLSITGLEPMQLSDLFSGINVSFLLSINNSTLSSLASGSKRRLKTACQTRTMQCKANRTKHSTVIQAEDNEDFEPTENVQANYESSSTDPECYVTNFPESSLQTLEPDYGTTEKGETKLEQKENSVKLEHTMTKEAEQDKSTSPASLQSASDVISQSATGSDSIGSLRAVSEIFTPAVESSVAKSNEETEQHEDVNENPENITTETVPGIAVSGISESYTAVVTKSARNSHSTGSLHSSSDQRTTNLESLLAISTEESTTYKNDLEVSENAVGTSEITATMVNSVAEHKEKAGSAATATETVPNHAVDTSKSTVAVVTQRTSGIQLTDSLPTNSNPITFMTGLESSVADKAEKAENKYAKESADESVVTSGFTTVVVPQSTSSSQKTGSLSTDTALTTTLLESSLAINTERDDNKSVTEDPDETVQPLPLTSAIVTQSTSSSQSTGSLRTNSELTTTFSKSSLPIKMGNEVHQDLTEISASSETEISQNNAFGGALESSTATAVVTQSTSIKLATDNFRTKSKLTSSFSEFSNAINTEESKNEAAKEVPDEVVGGKSESTAAILTTYHSANNEGNNGAEIQDDFELAHTSIKSTTVIAVKGANDKAKRSPAFSASQVLVVVLSVCLVFFVSLGTATLSIKYNFNPFKRIRANTTVTTVADAEQTCTVAPIVADSPEIFIDESASVDPQDDILKGFPYIHSASLTSAIRLDQFHLK